jgi:hypothetical protein
VELGPEYLARTGEQFARSSPAVCCTVSIFEFQKTPPTLAAFIPGEGENPQGI